MKIDFKKWQKVSENPTHTTFQNKEGHSLQVAHKALHPATRGQLAALPMSKPAKLADGGQVPEPDKQKAKQIQDSSQQSGWNPKQWASNAKEGLGLADGGDVPASTPAPSKQQQNQDLANEIKDPTLRRQLEKGARGFADGGDVAPIEADLGEAPPAPPAEAAPEQVTPSAAPTADPALARKRELYNYAVAQLAPDSGTNPRAVLGPSMTFGEQGQAPAQFNPAAWTKAEQAFQNESVDKTKSAAMANKAAIVDNAARQAAGLPPNPVPEAPAQTPSETPKAVASAPSMPAPGAAPSDPYGTDAYQNAYVRGVSEQKAGMQGEAAAAQATGEASANALAEQQKNQQENIQNYQTHYNNLDQERKNFVQDIQDGHIDPNHYLNSMGTGSKIATAIGLIAGGIGGGLTHTGNPVQEFLTAQIDRDVQAQRANLGKKESLLNANMRQFGNIRDATDMTRAMQSDIVSNQLKEAAAKQAGPMAKARLLQAAGQLDMQTAPVMAQIAMRKTLLGGMQQGKISPEIVLRSGIVDPKDHEAFRKELGEAQNAVSLRDNTLSAFDQLAKINTVGGALNPQTHLQINALRGAALDKLTKDTSGRVTPETIKLIGGLFDTKFANPESIATERRTLNNLLSQGMHYPTLKAYGQDVNKWGRNPLSGSSRIPESAPITK